MEANCVNCGAPSGPSVCSYCSTPRFRDLVARDSWPKVADVTDGAINVLYGYAVLRPEICVTYR